MDISLFQYEALCVISMTSIIIVLITAVIYSEVHNNKLYSRYIERLEEDNKDNDNNKVTGWKYEYNEYEYKQER